MSSPPLTVPHIAKGTIQSLPVKVNDALSHLSSLVGLDVKYDLYTADENETEIGTNFSCTIDTTDELIALPLIDTTSLAEGLYKFFIHFVASPETPRLGPYYFWVDD